MIGKGKGAGWFGLLKTGGKIMIAAEIAAFGVSYYAYRYNIKAFQRLPRLENRPLSKIWEGA